MIRMTATTAKSAPNDTYPTAVESPTQNVFDPADGLVGILWRAIAHNEDILVTLESGDGIVLVPSSSAYVKYTTNLRAFCKADFDSYTVKCLDADYQEQFRRTSKLARCMSELLWQAGLFGSKGRLIEGCGQYDVVQLTRWPNLTRVPATPSAMTIAALLSNYPTNIDLAKRLTGVDEEEMNTFCSAAFAARSLRILGKTETVREPKLKPHRDRSILGLIMHRLRS